MVNKNINQKPWMIDVDFVTSVVNKKLEIVDFEKFKFEVSPKLFDFNETINIFRNKIEIFEKILGRYDELLLEKASKDDFSSLKLLFPLYCKAADFNSYKFDTISQFALIENRQTVYIDSINQVNDQLDAFNFNYKIFKKDMKVFLAFYSTIDEIKAKFKEKADKVDLYSMMDTMSKQEDMIATTQAINDMHRQLEMLVMLHLATIKSLLKTTETVGAKNRQRFEIYRNSSSLLNWVVNSIAPEMDKLFSVAKNLINSSYAKSPSESPDLVLPSLPRHHKKRSVNLTPSPMPSND